MPANYLILYGLIVTAIVISLLFARRRDTPVRLDLKGSNKDDAEKSQPAKSKAPVRPETRPQQSRPDTRSHASDGARATKPGETSLNVFFNWNGHSWDAYEVLGLPAGSSRESVHSALEHLIKNGEPESVPFYRAAHDAIMGSSRTRD